MLNMIQQMEFLSQISPFIQKLSGRIIVVKYGGAAMKNEILTNKVLEDIFFLSCLGIKIILVHGGGPMINHWLKKCNIEPKFNKGIRVTDKSTMEIVEMVLVGKVNKELVAILNKKKNCAIGLSGKDGNLVIASRLFDVEDNFVGKVDRVNTKILDILIDANYIPIIASIAADIQGQTYNINADTFAGAIATSIGAEKLIFLTDTPGVMSDVNNMNTLIKNLKINQVNKLKAQKIIYGGMIPKIECCIKALEGNVSSTHIIDGKVDHSLLLEIFTNDRIGSMITL